MQYSICRCNGRVEVGDFAYFGTGALLTQETESSPLRIGKEFEPEFAE